MSIDKNIDCSDCTSQDRDSTLRIPKFEWPPKNKYHNSINNPRFPKPLEQSELHSSFTVIGNMVTKEFVQCVELLNIMHKYKSRHFGKPLIEGLTQLEWAEALKDLKYEFGHDVFSKRNQQVTVLFENKMIGDYNDLKAMIEQTYYINRPSFNAFERGVEELRKYVTGTERLFVYLNIAVNGDSIGTLIVELYTDLVPLTCANFMRLCTKRNGGYSGSPVHRIVKDGWLQCGGYTLKSVKMPCENYAVLHDRRGVLSMANNGRHCDNSTQFFINLQRADWMDSKYVAFGQVIFGDNTLRTIEQLGTRYEAPIDRVVIFRTGQLDLEQDMFPSNEVKSFTDGHIQNVSQLVGQIIEQLWEAVEPLLKEIKKPVIYVKYQPILPLEQDIGKTDKFIYSTITIPVEQEEDNSKLSEQCLEQVSEQVSKQVLEEVLTKVSIQVLEPINETVPLKNSLKTESDAKAQSFSKPKLFFHSLVNVTDRAENSLLEIEVEPSQTMFTEIKNVDNVSKYHLTIFPQEKGYIQMDSDEEREAYAYVQEHADQVSFSGPTIAKIAKKIYGSYNIDSINNTTIQECYCKIRTSSSHQFVRESIIHVGKDEMTETTLARFLGKRSTNQPLSLNEDSKPEKLKCPAQQSFYKENEKRVEERKRLSSSVLKKRITNFGHQQEIVLDSTKKRPSITVAAYKLKNVATKMFAEVDSQSSASTCTCDASLSSGSVFSKDTDSLCGKDDNSSTASFKNILPGLHLKGDTPTYVSMWANRWKENCYAEENSLLSVAEKDVSL